MKNSFKFIFLIFLFSITFTKANFVAYLPYTSPDGEQIVHLLGDIHFISDGKKEDIKQNFHKHQSDLMNFIKKNNAFPIIEDRESFLAKYEGDNLLIRYERDINDIINRALEVAKDCTHFTPIFGLEHLFRKNKIPYLNVEFRYKIRNGLFFLEDCKKIEKLTINEILDQKIKNQHKNIVVCEGISHIIEISKDLEQRGYKKGNLYINPKLRQECLKNDQFRVYFNSIFNENREVIFNGNDKKFIKFLINNPIDINKAGKSCI